MTSETSSHIARAWAAVAVIPSSPEPSASRQAAGHLRWFSAGGFPGWDAEHAAIVVIRSAHPPIRPAVRRASCSTTSRRAYAFDARRANPLFSPGRARTRTPRAAIMLTQDQAHVTDLTIKRNYLDNGACIVNIKNRTDRPAPKRGLLRRGR